MNYTINILYSEEDRGYVAVIPDLPGCSAFGKTQGEALKEARIAGSLWLDVEQKKNNKIPVPTYF